MSETEKLKLQRATLDQQLAAAEKAEVAESLRASFKRLAEDDSLPILEIVGKALTARGKVPPPSSLDRLADRLAVVLRAYD